MEEVTAEVAMVAREVERVVVAKEAAKAVVMEEVVERQRRR